MKIDTQLRIFKTLCIILFVTLWIVGLQMYRDARQQSRPQPVWDVNNLSLPAPADIQTLLNRIEPNPRLTVDGRIGPKTLEKWDRVYLEISAKQ